MSDFTVHPLGGNRVEVRRGKKTALVYKLENIWVVDIGGIKSDFAACAIRHPPDMTKPCPYVARDCMRAGLNDISKHMAKFCHGMHGPRMAGIAAAMLGSVVFQTPRIADIRKNYGDADA